MHSNIHNFIEKATHVHGGKYDYTLVTPQVYRNIRSKLPIQCPQHGIFYQRGDDHNRGRGCPLCKHNSVSHKALSWLEHVASTEHVYIQHAGNIGEFCIPNTKYRVDGFCETTNIVYEFDGDAFHGNPARYGPTETCHPYDRSITAVQLQTRTKNRQDLIKSLGYTLVTMWESDFDKLNIPTSRFNMLIQSATDPSYTHKLLECGMRIIGEYTGAKDKHQMECLGCGCVVTGKPITRTWTKKRYPNTYGCVTCSQKRKAQEARTRSDYVERLGILGYAVTGYTNAKTPATLTCMICNRTKTVVPSAIIQSSTRCCFL